LFTWASVGQGVEQGWFSGTTFVRTHNWIMKHGKILRKSINSKNTSLPSRPPMLRVVKRHELHHNAIYYHQIQSAHWSNIHWMRVQFSHSDTNENLKKIIIGRIGSYHCSKFAWTAPGTLFSFRTLCTHLNPSMSMWRHVVHHHCSLIDWRTEIQSKTPYNQPIKLKSNRN